MTRFEKFLEKQFPAGADIHGQKVLGSSMSLQDKYVGIATVAIENRGGYVVVLEPPGAGILLLTSDMKIGLVRQVRMPVHTHNWELILGTIEDGETPEEAARREAKQEFDIDVTSDQLEKLPFTVNPSPSRSTDNTQVYLVRADCTSDKFDSEELTGKGLFTIPEVKQMIRNGEITEGISLACIYWLLTEL